MLSIAVCDDEKEWLDHTLSWISDYFRERSDIPFRITPFASGLELITYVEKNGGFDLYILDVVMPGMTGIETGMELRRLDNLGRIVYLTTSREYAVESYLTDAFCYLVKEEEAPGKRQTGEGQTWLQLRGVLDRIVVSYRKQREKGLSVKTKTNTQRILFDDILYVELVKKALSYHLGNGEVVTSTSQRVVLPKPFCRC